MEKVAVAVIGGGITGLAVAYNLAKLGVNRVVVFERGYPGIGATGRSGGGIRAQFSTPETIILARESERLFEGLSEELNFNVLFRQGGYLFLAYTEEEVKQYKENVKLQNSLGVRSRFIQPEEAAEIVPDLNADIILGATYFERDGVAVHQGALWGYAQAARRLGVKFSPFTEVKSINVEANAVRSVLTSRGSVETDCVVNAAGAHSAPIAESVGVSLPIKPYRREALATEPMKPFFDPMIVSLKGEWLFQTLRGEVVGGVSDNDEPPSYNINSSLKFLQQTAKSWTRIIPRLRGVNVIRQWAGLYDVTPDSKPILGQVEEVQGFLQACGFSGHGFMLAPIVGQLLAELIVNGKPTIPLQPFLLKRFERAEITRETAVI